MFIRVEASSGVPIWRQIADQIRAQCAIKSLVPGDCLPSVRVLAQQLAVNQNTILKVYERLTAEGLLERRHGSGTYVAQTIRSGKLQTGQLKLLRRQIDQLVFKALTLNIQPEEVCKLVEKAFEQANRKTQQSKSKPSKRKTNE